MPHKPSDYQHQHVMSLLSLSFVLDTFHFVLVQALAGEVGMSSELDDVARALFNGQIPGIWRRLAPATLKSLGNWMIHFERRLKQYNGWVSLFQIRQK